MEGGAHSRTLATQRSRPFRWLVRVGFYSRGLTYGIVGGLALALALGAGTGGTAPDQQGALTLLSRHFLGRLALVVVAAGLLAYATWKITQGVLGRGPEGGGSPELKDRFANLAGGIAYLAFFLVALRALIGAGGSSSSGEPKHAAAGVLGWPGGPVLVGVGGAILIGISVYQVYEAFTGAFAQETRTGSMSAEERRAFTWLGRFGITARALVFALIGYFLIRAAVDFNASKAVGVDGALAQLHHEPLGPLLLALVAAGLLAFALYSLMEGRYRRL